MPGEQILTDRPLPGARVDMSHPLARDLIACFLLNENGGVLAMDSTPYQNHGILTNFATPPKRAFNGLQFNGTNAYIVGQTKNLYLFGAKPHSYIVWYYLDAFTAANTYLVSTGNDSAGEQSGFAISTTGQYICSGYTAPLVLTTATPVTVKKFSAAGLSIDGTNALFYHDGIFVESAVIALNTKIGKLKIGSNIAGNTPFNGRIALVQVYRRALTRDEFKANFISPYAPYGTALFI